jgi:hypothetical protein
MNITKVSGLTGNTHTMDIDVTMAQLEAWQGGELIQQVMPNLSADDREFLMTGSTPQEWDDVFGGDD